MSFLSLVENNKSDKISLDDYLIRDRDASFMLKVKGDSMINAGIRDGDMVIVERGKNPRAGDIVIARVDGEFTIKYYCVQKGHVYLEAANPKYEPIYPETELTIEAVVIAVVRRYYH